jgi:hypothetical protein
MKIKISIRIIVIFTTAIIFSLISDQIHVWLGDWYCQGSGKLIIEGIYSHHTNCDNGNYHEATWHWGYRHYLYFLMGFSLAIVQIVDIINIIKTPTK